MGEVLHEGEGRSGQTNSTCSPGPGAGAAFHTPSAGLWCRAQLVKDTNRSPEDLQGGLFLSAWHVPGMEPGGDRLSSVSSQ